MCRFLIYSGHSPILLSHLITAPTHSILTQSYDSRLRLDQTRPHNGDGFGVGYYTATPSTTKSEAPQTRQSQHQQDLDHQQQQRPQDRRPQPPSHLPSFQPRKDDPPIDLGPEPCIFTSTIPAWNCRNLERLASKTVSPLIFAHVRASTEGALSDSNCHPFSRGALMWMHNGGIGGWKLGVKKKLVLDIEDRWFESVSGSTDSEHAFALFLDTLTKLGADPDDFAKQRSGFGHSLLRKAMLRTIERINGFIKELPLEVREAGDTRSLLNFAVTDGHSVVCTRYVSSRSDEAASLFFSSGTNWREQNPSTPEQGYFSTGAPKVGKGEYKMERRDKGADIVLVASEPLTFERDNWVTVPTNSVLTIHNQTVLLHPILDEFYNVAPALPRSSRYAADKGQTIGDGLVGGKNVKNGVVESDLAKGVGALGIAAG